MAFVTPVVEHWLYRIEKQLLDLVFKVPHANIVLFYVTKVPFIRNLIKFNVANTLWFSAVIPAQYRGGGQFNSIRF